MQVNRLTLLYIELFFRNRPLYSSLSGVVRRVGGGGGELGNYPHKTPPQEKVREKIVQTEPRKRNIYSK